MKTISSAFLLSVLILMLNLPVKADNSKAQNHTVSFQSNVDTAEIDKKLNSARRLINVNPVQGISYARAAEKLAIETNDQEKFITANYLLGENYHSAQIHDTAIIFLRKSLRLQSSADSMSDFSSHNLLGVSYHFLHNRDSAFYFLNIAREIALVQENNETNLAAVSNNLALVYDAYGDLNTAIDYYMEALKMFEDLGQLENVATLYNNIGVINQSNGEHEKSLEYFMKSLEIGESLGNNSAIIRATTNLGTSYSSLERFDEARQAFEKAMNLSLQFGFNYEITRAYFNLGNLYQRIKEFEKARDHYLKSYEMSVQFDITLGRLYSCLNLAETETYLGELTSAGERLNEAERIIDDFGLDVNRGQLLSGYFQLEEAKGNYENALRYHKMFKAFEDSVREVKSVARMQEILARYESEKKNLENQQLRDKNLIQETTIQNQRLIGGLFILTFLLLSGILITFIISRKKLSKFNSELTHLNNTLNEQRESLALSNEAKDKLFSIIAHDLRSPFNGLLGFLDLLIDDFDSFEDSEKLDILISVKKQAGTTFGLLENLLQWSMNQRGLFRAKMEIHSLKQIADAQIEGLAMRAESKNIQITNLIPPGFEALLDENMTKTIFRNLVNNSIKFTKQGGQITISGESDSNLRIVKISDNGIGMSKEIADRLFSDHYPVSRQGTESEKGTGLGLMIVKDFIEKQNAQIRVESKTGEGSTFIILFKSHNA